MKNIIVCRDKNENNDPARWVHNLAFNQIQQCELIDNIWNKKEFIPDLSLAAINIIKVIGNILLFPLMIVSKTREIATLSLVPMPVRQDSQHGGMIDLLKNILKLCEIKYTINDILRLS